MHKILQKLFCKVSWNIQISFTNFLCNISTTLQKYFPKDYKKCCVNIPTIITRKVSEKFLKYFVYGLNRRLKHFTKYFGKFNATFIEIFHASFFLRYLQHYTQNLTETFLQSFKKFSDLGQKIFKSIFPQPCRSISRKITGNVA